ncbi:hypothetical protein ACFB49_42830 [Sphingomonas sp. DBB INV C78]|uniref:carph-isopro domain-containing protein n=1 Tax=Sphingomonas sp. DBB INV C78 TaxID=3349434 RepID=UPI0036D2B57E
MGIQAIIESFGGIRGMATKLGHRNHTTVQGWADRGLIPAQRQKEVLDAARKYGIEVNLADIIPDPPTPFRNPTRRHRRTAPGRVAA